MVNGEKLKSTLSDSSDDYTKSSVYIELFSRSLIESAIFRLKEKDEDKAFKASKYLGKIRSKDPELKELKAFFLDIFNGCGQIDTFEKALNRCYDQLVEDFVEEEEDENRSIN